MDVSIVIPVFNSAQSLSELEQRITETMSKLDRTFEIILVDDASKDESWQEIKKIKSKSDTRIIAVQLNKNTGQHNAIICGLNFSKGDIIITMDDDLQHPPEEIPKLLDKYDENQSEVVYGIYKSREHSKIRSVSSTAIRKTSKVFSSHKSGLGSSFRLFTRNIVDKLTVTPQNFVFIDEIIHWYTGDIDQVMVEHHRRKEGKSSYSMIKLFRLYLSIVINFTAWPLKLMVYGGMITSVFSFAIGLMFIFKKLYYHVDVEGFTALIVAITFSSSLILMSLGIIGQYLYRIYQHQNGKPPYSIKKVL